MNRMKRETYEKETQKRLEGLYGRVDQVQDYINEHGTQRAEPELEQHLEALEERRTETRGRWEALKKATEGDWDQARAEMDESIDNLNKALVDARVHLERDSDTSLGWTEGFTDEQEHDSEGWPEGAGEIDENSEGWPEGAGEIDENSEGWEEGYDEAKKPTS